MITFGNITPYYNGYMYTTQLTNLVEVIIDGQTYTSTNQSHTFSGGDYCKILECDSYPFLENVSVSLSLNGVSTDQYGVYTVLIPNP